VGPTAGIDILENIKFSYMSGIGHRRARYTTSSVPPDFRCLTVDSRVRDDDPDGVATTSISISGAFNYGSPFVRHNDQITCKRIDATCNAGTS